MTDMSSKEPFSLQPLEVCVSLSDLERAMWEERHTDTSTDSGGFFSSVRSILSVGFIFPRLCGDAQSDRVVVFIQSWKLTALIVIGGSLIVIRRSNQCLDLRRCVK